MQLETLKNNLIRRGFATKIYETKESLKKDIESIIQNKSVGFGGSMTLKNLGILDIINQNAKKVFPHITGECGENERSALTADIFFLSANAISLEGEIVNIDGTGNRIAATCFGPQKVIYIIGKNKITKNLESALERAKIAAVKVAKRLDRKTPCTKTGKCEDCLSPGCVCSVTTIHRKRPHGVNMDVLILNEECGI